MLKVSEEVPSPCWTDSNVPVIDAVLAALENPSGPLFGGVARVPNVNQEPRVRGWVKRRP